MLARGQLSLRMIPGKLPWRFPITANRTAQPTAPHSPLFHQDELLWRAEGEPWLKTGGVEAIPGSASDLRVTGLSTDLCSSVLSPVKWGESHRPHRAVMERE